MSREEQHLVSQIEPAIAHFDELGVCITQTVLCGYLHISMNDLAGRYPYAREMLSDAKERTRHRPRLQINNLYQRVVGVIQMLETQQEPVTRHTICMRLQITVHTINHDPEVKALIDGVMAEKRSVAKAARRALYENELIECLHKTYALLAATQDVFSYTRLCIATGKDERTFRQYPRASMIAKQLVATHEREVCCAREELVVILNTYTIEMLEQVVTATFRTPNTIAWQFIATSTYVCCSGTTARSRCSASSVDFGKRSESLSKMGKKSQVELYVHNRLEHSNTKSY